MRIVAVTSKSDAMIAGDIFATLVTGATNFKRITRYEFVIGVMLFIVAGVTKWINAMIVVKLFVVHARRC